MRSREAGEFLSGALAGAMTKAVLAPLETIRLVFAPCLLVSIALVLLLLYNHQISICYY